MEDLGAKIKQFIHFQLKDGDQTAGILSNTMLYAFDIASSDDFFEFYKTIPHHHQPEPVEDPNELAL